VRLLHFTAAKTCRAHAVIVPRDIGLALRCQTTSLDHVTPIGFRQRNVCILLDKQHALPLPAELGVQIMDLLRDKRCQAQQPRVVQK